MRERQQNQSLREETIMLALEATTLQPHVPTSFLTHHSTCFRRLWEVHTQLTLSKCAEDTNSYQERPTNTKRNTLKNTYIVNMRQENTRQVLFLSINLEEQNAFLHLTKLRNSKRTD